MENIILKLLNIQYALLYQNIKNRKLLIHSKLYGFFINELNFIYIS